MKQRILIRNGTIVNEGQSIEGDLFIENGRVAQVGGTLSKKADLEIDASGLHILPGVIDDQVHFREPGLTHKAEIATESRAAVAGGVTSYMEMPNTKPPATTQKRLEEKYTRAAKTSLANYSFFMGAANDNLDEVLRTDPKEVCGIKVFMGSSTGNMLVDKEQTLRGLFSKSPMLIATHSEDEATIRANEEQYRYKYGEEVPFHLHPEIRSVEACYKSSSMAVSLAKENNSRLHILHISTARELGLFDSSTPLKDKRITAEVCVHHLWFDEVDYLRLGSKIKCNPAIKTGEDRKALLKGLKSGLLDIIATDHAPHTREEKAGTYFNAPSGLPLVQHPLVMMLEFVHQGLLDLHTVVEKMAHAPATCFRISERGFIREGYWADLALVNLNSPWTVDKHNLYYKCGWSPLEGQHFRSRVLGTMVSGHLAYSHHDITKPAVFDDRVMGKRMRFEV
jgi:dihydroorotase